MPLKLSTASSGSVTLDAANTASNFVLTIPAVTATMATLTTPAFVSTIGVGGATPANSGAGITFPSTQSGTSEPNTLDDYEEGTFTPTLTFGNNSTGITYSSQTGTYTKIGNMVRVFASLTLTNKGSSTGTVGMSGFPFSNPNSGNPVAAIYGQLNGITSQIIPYISGTSVTYEVLGTGAQSSLTNSNVNNNSSFFVSITYQAS